jgi:hypothetical protein
MTTGLQRKGFLPPFPGSHTHLTCRGRSWQDLHPRTRVTLTAAFLLVAQLG